MLIHDERMQGALTAEAATDLVNDKLAELLEGAAEEAGVEPLAHRERTVPDIEEEALQVAQLDVAPESVATLAVTTEVMSDLGEAGLVGVEDGAGWEAQDLAFADPAAGATAGSFWTTTTGMAVIGGGVVAAAAIANNNASSGGGNGLDTSVVVFDLRTGVSSDHSGRTFSDAESYDIYVIVDQNDGGAFGDVDWGSVDIVWGGVQNLDGDDHIHFVLATGGMDIAPLTASPAVWSGTSIQSWKVSVSSGWDSGASNHHLHWAILANEGTIFAGMGFSSITTHTSVQVPPTWVTLISNSGTGTVWWPFTASNVDVLNSIPAGLLTSQGLV